jgi:hypothetical protein
MRSFMARAEEPITLTVPASGAMIDMIMRMVVLLPAPFGPRKPHSERSAISSEMSLTAFTLPKLLQTPLRSTAGREPEDGSPGDASCCPIED